MDSSSLPWLHAETEQDYNQAVKFVDRVNEPHKSNIGDTAK